MGHHSILQATEDFVRSLLKEKLSQDLFYHNLPHTLAVKKACEQLAEKCALSNKDKKVLVLAALLHDVGFTAVYEEHEQQSQAIATDFLAKQGYPAEEIDRVKSCIKATYPPHAPVGVLEELIRDADMYHLASEDYMQFNESLRHEWEVFQDRFYSDSEWLQLNYDFFRQHEYYTEAASTLFGPQKVKNLKALKKMVKKNKNKKDPPEKEGISSNRSAQMMFKTALRNHLDLSNLADNKANIMLSVNALIITILVTGEAAGSILDKDNAYVWPALGVLLGTCLVSMIYATTATRPIKMMGYTTDEKIKAGESNLFFFGNFYQMNYQEFQSGMQQVIMDKDHLESSIMRDLYFLGRSLGHKYRRLRVCYTVFMVGIFSTVIVFLVFFAIDQGLFTSTT